MSQNYKKASFKKLLEKLQEESWQLELLISGFAIFGLFYAKEPIDKAFFETVKSGEMIFMVTYSTVKIFILIMIFNLLLHIILRGLWIGALGLRYVSGEINYDKLNYSPKFNTYLRKKVGSFDNYIGKLENYCSVIFAISFLLIFYVIALIMVLLLISFIGTSLIDNEYIPNWIAKGIGVPLMIFMIIGMLLTFFDFITQGLLKKKQWIAKIYFPFYWVFSIITLSFLYRPLVYNFLDHKFGKRISYILIPFYLLMLIISNFYYQKSNFFTNQNNSNEIIANHNNYEDLKEDDLIIFSDFSIQSKVITDPFLKIYLPFHNGIENRIFKFNPNLKPKKDQRGLHSNMIQLGNSISKKKRDSLKVIYVNTFNKIYSIKIDTTHYKSDFIIDKVKNEKFGFETYIGIKNLTEGKHLITFSRLKKKDSLGLKVITKIPFWYFKK